MRGPSTLYFIFIAAVLLGSLHVHAELQNVVVNGGYGTDAKESIAHVSLLVQDEAGRNIITPKTESLLLEAVEPIDSEFFAGRAARAAIRVSRVHIPERVRPAKYSDLGRVFLAFYLGQPETARSPVEITITFTGHAPYVSEYRVFTGSFEEPGWHPRLVDVGPWVGQLVDVTIRAAWAAEGKQAALIGLPRLVATHGPYYEGHGGIQLGPGPHGMPIAASVHAQTIHEDGSEMNGGMLLVRRYDCLEESTVRMASAIQDYQARLMPGIHWLPVQLPASLNPEVLTGIVDGRAEQGPIDVVPNFMANDEARLQSILEDHGSVLRIPKETPLFHPASEILSGLSRK